MSEKREFKILSIDGGGIRGLYPTQYLACIENGLKDRRIEGNLNEYFDLICGTSTGGIIAIGLGLGMTATELNKFYLDEAKKIFGWKFIPLFRSKYNNKRLESLLKANFKQKDSLKKEGEEKEDAKIWHSATRLCIPAYNAYNGKVNVYKTCHDTKLHIDHKIPAYQVAMATAAAPTYFNPYSINYMDGTNNINMPYNLDGGILANNPTMIGILEAVALGYSLSEIKVLSIGTCTRVYKELEGRSRWGAMNYWLHPWNMRLLDMIFQAQSIAIEHQVKILNEGLGMGSGGLFKYQRIQHEFHSDEQAVKLDEGKTKKLNQLNQIAQEDYKEKGERTIELFFNKKVTPYTKHYTL